VVGRQTTVSMADIKNVRHLVTLDAPSGDVNVVDYTDTGVVLVFHSMKSGEIAEFWYESQEITPRQARRLAREYANGYVRGLQE